MIQSNFFVRHFTIGKSSHSLGSRPNKMIKILLFVDRTENQPFFLVFLFHYWMFMHLWKSHLSLSITNIINRPRDVTQRSCVTSKSKHNYPYFIVVLSPMQVFTFTLRHLDEAGVKLLHSCLHTYEVMKTPRVWYSSIICMDSPLLHSQWRLKIKFCGSCQATREMLGTEQLCPLISMQLTGYGIADLFTTIRHLYEVKYFNTNVCVFVFVVVVFSPLFTLFLFVLGDVWGCCW